MNANASTLAKDSQTAATWRLIVGYVLSCCSPPWRSSSPSGILVNDWRLPSPPSAPTSAARIEHADALYHVLLALTAIMVLGRLLGKVFQHFGQPRVIGEMIAGIMLGPSLLGWIWPAAYEFLLPKEVGPHLGIIAQIGVILYMFLIGLELNAGMLRSRARHGGHIPCQHCHAVFARWIARALVVSARR